MNIKKRIITASVAVLLFISLTVIPTTFVYGGNRAVPLTSVSVYAAEDVQKVEEDEEITKDDVTVEKVNPSIGDKLEYNIYTPMETIIFFGGIIVLLGIILAIVIIAALSKKKRK